MKLNRIVLFQNINILLMFILWTLGLWQGFVVLVYAVLFILCIQLPAFCYLVWKKGKVLSSSTAYGIKLGRLQEHSSLLIILVLLILDTYVPFINPFYNDKYTIEVLFKPDESCIVSFNEQVIGKGRAHYYSHGSSGVFCQGGESSVLFHAFLDIPKNEMIQPKEYELNKVLGYGGYFSNEMLGGEYSPSFVAPVYWGLVSGVLKVTSVKAKEGEASFLSPAVITGTLKVVAKRRHESPIRIWPL